MERIKYYRVKNEQRPFLNGRCYIRSEKAVS